MTNIHHDGSLGSSITFAVTKSLYKVDHRHMAIRSIRRKTFMLKVLLCAIMDTVKVHAMSSYCEVLSLRSSSGVIEVGKVVRDVKAFMDE